MSIHSVFMIIMCLNSFRYLNCAVPEWRWGKAGCGPLLNKAMAVTGLSPWPAALVSRRAY